MLKGKDMMQIGIERCGQKAEDSYLDNNFKSIQDAVLKTWIDILLSPTESFTELLIFETQARTNLKATKQDICEFLIKIAQKQSVIETKQQPIKKRTIANDIKIVPPSHCDQYTKTTPKCFYIGNKPFYNRTWKDILLTLCHTISEQNHNDFYRVIKDIIGKERKYFSKKPNMENPPMTEPRKIEGTDIYVETNLSANNTKALCDTIYNYFGYGNELKVDLERKKGI